MNATSADWLKAWRSSRPLSDRAELLLGQVGLFFFCAHAAGERVLHDDVAQVLRKGCAGEDLVATGLPALLKQVFADVLVVAHDRYALRLRVLLEGRDRRERVVAKREVDDDEAHGAGVGLGRELVRLVDEHAGRLRRLQRVFDLGSPEQIVHEDEDGGVHGGPPGETTRTRDSGMDRDGTSR